MALFSGRKILSYIPDMAHVLKVELRMTGKAVIFGAGKVGLSLVGLVFSRGGYEVVFVDVVDEIVNELNKRRQYTIEVKDKHPEVIRVSNVRAVNAKNSEEVAQEIATADVLATVVGVNNLPHVYGNIAKGLLKRAKEKGPLDIIICENLRNSSRLFRSGLIQHLPKDYPLDQLVGLVETSTDKMVPDMPREMRQKDPLLVYAEAFSTLIADKKAFKGEIPRSPDLQVKENIEAYFDRKFFSLNTGHAVAAYIGYLTGYTYIWEAMGDPKVMEVVQGAMWESGRVLIAEYPN
jgi:mannitol-1-phosphate 5-dehydrogenase